MPRLTQRTLASFLLAVALSVSAIVRPAAAQTTAAEARTSHALDLAKRQGTPELYAMLKTFPKGADLHMHLSGAIYAETFIAEAIRQGLCVDTTLLKLTPTIPGDNKTPTCAAGSVPSATALIDQHLYDSLIDSFSMRAFVPTPGTNGHDQFFATFDRFGGLKDFSGEWLDEVAMRANNQNEQYLEIMQTPPFSQAAALGYKIGWPVGADRNITPEQLATVRDSLLEAGLRDEVAIDSRALADAKAKRAQVAHCTVPPAAPDPMEHKSCHVQIHFIYQVLRAFSPQQVFAQTLLGFEVASADPDVVGINFVQPEDARLAMRDYHLQMQMLDYLHSVYPKVHISLHAGEVAPGLVPPDGLGFHIRQAINLGHAERIGHGVDVLYENNPNQLLAQMAKQHVMVEINLTSNDVILGVKGTDHPLAAYRAAHVPFALSTDDEGVSRIDLTHEYVRAVTEQNLNYLDLKLSARTSLEHSFLHGDSLYLHPDDFAHRKPACAAPITATSEPAPDCAALLKDNEKAAEQYELEHRFVAFEAHYAPAPRPVVAESEAAAH